MKAFPWRRGMAIRRQDEIDVVIEVRTAADGTVRICWATDAQGVLDDGEELPPAPYAPWGWVCASDVEPDPNDGATKGGFLEAVREALGNPEAHLIRLKTHDHDPENPTGDAIPVLWWALADRHGHLIVSTTPEGFPRYLAGPTEFAALEAAWQAAP